MTWKEFEGIHLERDRVPVPKPPVCDLCPRPATWQHRQGGYPLLDVPAAARYKIGVD